jgi:hypothetical protein
MLILPRQRSVLSLSLYDLSSSLKIRTTKDLTSFGLNNAVNLDSKTMAQKSSRAYKSDGYPRHYPQPDTAQNTLAMHSKPAQKAT